MFFHLQYIHLFRPFLRYAPKASPLPPHVSPRRICTANAGAISKLMRLYKKTYNLRQICNIAVYMLHSACTIHLLNLPEKTARRDIIHGVKHLEEIAEDWVCGRRTLSIISVLSRKWKVDLPDEAAQVLQRTDDRWGTFNTSDVPSPRSNVLTTTPSSVKTTPSPQQRYESQSPTRHQVPSPQAPSPPLLYGNMTPETINSTVTSRPDFRPQSQPPLAGQMVSSANTVRSVDTNPASNPDPIPIDFSGLSPADWTSTSLRDAVSSFSQPYAPFAAGGQVGERSQGVSSSQTATQATMPTSLFAVDGHDWYLKDGVNWQASFNAWNMGNSNVPQQSSVPSSVPEQQQLFVFGPGASQIQTQQQQQHGPGYPANPNPGHIPAAVDLNFDSLHALSSIDPWDLSNLE